MKSIPALAAVVSVLAAVLSASAQTRPAATATPTPRPAATATPIPRPAATATPIPRPAATATPIPRPVAPAPVASVNVAVPPTKIALVDTGMFADEKAGIKRYVNAARIVQREFEPRNLEFTNLQARLKALAEEINRLSGAPVVDPKTIQAKREEGERLQRELKYKKEQADADVEKRYKEVVGPVSADIGRALDQYASQHGLTMILDISKLLPAVLTMNPSMDITNAFIAEYNSKNP